MPPVSGYHLFADGTGVSRSPDDIATFLYRALVLTGLKAIAPPTVSENQGIVLIAESHVAVHFEGDRGWADVFSCRRFPARPMLAVLHAVFGGEWKWGYFRRAVPDGSIKQ